MAFVSHLSLLPRARSCRPADLATRARLIANQRSPARRIRRVRRSLRTAARLLAFGFVLAAMTVMAGLATRWLRSTPLLAVATVEVVGGRRLSEESIRAAIGVEPGANIFALDPVAIEARVGELPGVRRARAVRHLPNRLTLVVEAREPYALVNRSGPSEPASADRLLWIDAKGYPAGEGDRPGVPALPILTGIERAADGSDRLSAEHLHIGLTLLRAVQRTGGRMAGRISEIYLAPAEGPVLYLLDGAEVRVGTESWDERLARLDGVLGELDVRGERVSSVDLRFRDLVVLRPRQTPPGSPDGGGGAAGTRRRLAPPVGVNP